MTKLKLSVKPGNGKAFEATREIENDQAVIDATLKGIDAAAGKGGDADPCGVHVYIGTNPVRFYGECTVDPQSILAAAGFNTKSKKAD